MVLIYSLVFLTGFLIFLWGKRKYKNERRRPSCECGEYIIGDLETDIHEAVVAFTQSGVAGKEKSRTALTFDVRNRVFFDGKVYGT